MLTHDMTMRAKNQLSPTKRGGQTTGFRGTWSVNHNTTHNQSLQWWSVEKNSGNDAISKLSTTFLHSQSIKMKTSTIHAFLRTYYQWQTYKQIRLIPLTEKSGQSHLQYTQLTTRQMRVRCTEDISTYYLYLEFWGSADSVLNETIISVGRHEPNCSVSYLCIQIKRTIRHDLLASCAGTHQRWPRRRPLSKPPIQVGLAKF